MTASTPRAPSRVSRRLHRLEETTLRPDTDEIAAEEPLEIRVTNTTADAARTLAVTMRTPGDDADLARGFLLTEGVISSVNDVRGIEPTGPETPNSVVVLLEPAVHIDWAGLERHVYTTSSCGVCGKTSIESVLDVRNRLGVRTEASPVSPRTLYGLLARALEHQPLFRSTGGCHAAALFDTKGSLLAVREDVGRHNAMDKLIGAMAAAGHLPLAEAVLLLSGRASFELVQKAACAGIPIVCAVGAPSTLAVELADAVGITLVGFLRDDRANVYTRPERIRGSGEIE